MTSRRSAESGRQEAAPEGEVLTSARLLTQVSYGNIYECSDDESAMAKKADGLDFEHVAVIGHKCWMFY